MPELGEAVTALAFLGRGQCLTWVKLYVPQAWQTPGGVIVFNSRWARRNHGQGRCLPRCYYGTPTCTGRPGSTGGGSGGRDAQEQETWDDLEGENWDDWGDTWDEPTDVTENESVPLTPPIDGATLVDS